MLRNQNKGKPRFLQNVQMGNISFKAIKCHLPSLIESTTNGKDIKWRRPAFDSEYIFSFSDLKENFKNEHHVSNSTDSQGIFARNYTSVVFEKLSCCFLCILLGALYTHIYTKIVIRRRGIWTRAEGEKMCCRS